MRDWIRHVVVLGLLVGGAVEAATLPSPLPWPTRASWDYCIRFGMAAQQIASIRDRASTKGFTIETARTAYSLGENHVVGGMMHEALVTAIYPSTLPKEGMAEEYAQACIKRYGLRPPSRQPSRVIILEYDR